MRGNAFNFENGYKKTKNLWGLKPDILLKENIEFIPKGDVLDLGSGPGRNALFFAKEGYAVKAVDSSETAIQSCKENAEALGVNVSAEARDIRDFEIEEGKYSLIIASMVLQFFSKKESVDLIKRIKKGLKPGGFVYIKTFSVDEPMYQEQLKNEDFEFIGNNTTYNKKENKYMNYFRMKEMFSYFKDFMHVQYADVTVPDLGYGDMHNHGMITYFGKKKIINNL